MSKLYGAPHLFSCDADYIGEIIHNSKIKWNDDKTGTDGNSDCVKRENDNFNHMF